VAIYLIRHAHAGNRARWAGDDGDRPLSDRGRAQAEHVAASLAGLPVREIWSSPARRCVETVEPLAAARKVKIRVTDDLAEGAEAEAAIAFLRSRAHKDAALCSHGDLLPKIVRRLSAAGMRTRDANISQKGSLWVFETDGTEVTAGRYVPPGPKPR
jgi:8-oxo-dGTP diphosphatase